MKEAAVHSLVIARTLLERSAPLCRSDDRYLATAGLIVAQDALEVVLYALLIEIGADEKTNLEKKTFDELLGEMKAAGHPVPKSGTLKILNKQRVFAKHYGQVLEPVTVRTYFAAAEEAIEAVSRSVLGKSIRDLFISDLLKNGEAKSFMQAAEKHVSDGDFLSALVETRKAIFVEFEEDFNVYAWRDKGPDAPYSLLASAMLGGWRAPRHTRNNEWIAKHVKVPTDYIQIDHSDLRLEAMEFGIHTVELENLRRLTPAVFRADRKADWSVTYDSGFPANNATEENARYCLDRAVSIVLKKQEHRGVRRDPAKGRPFDPPTIYFDAVIYARPSTGSEALHQVSKDFIYTINRVVGGFDPKETFYELFAESFERSDEPPTLLGPDPKYSYRGYLHILPEAGEGGVTES